MNKSIRFDTHVLYRFFDADGLLLYVGITNDPLVRFRAHGTDKSWYPRAVTATLTHFDSREELASAEWMAIQAEKPKYNRTHAAMPLTDKIGVKVNNSPAVSVFGADASSFQSPDAIACDDEPLDLGPDVPPRAWQQWPCTDCHALTIYREFDDLVRCDTCLNMWLWDEWRKLNFTLPRHASLTSL